MDKEEIKNLLWEEITEAVNRTHEIKARTDEIKWVVFQNRALSKSKKKGNVCLIIAAALIVLTLILTAMGSSIGALTMFWTCWFLIPGIIRKINGLREHKKLSEELRYVDVQAIEQEYHALILEESELNIKIDRVLQERAKLYRYTGKEWRLNEMTAFDAETLQQLETDLRDVVSSINYSSDEMFISNNWLINNIMLYMTFGLNKDTENTDRICKALDKINAGSTSWSLRLLTVLILAGSIRLLTQIADDADTEQWDTALERAKIGDPVEPEDVEFYADATLAADKCIELVAKVMKK